MVSQWWGIRGLLATFQTEPTAKQRKRYAYTGDLAFQTQSFPIDLVTNITYGYRGHRHQCAQQRPHPPVRCVDCISLASFNLAVAEAHTYFVDSQQWLVHNACQKINSSQSRIAGETADTIRGRQARNNYPSGLGDKN